MHLLYVDESGSASDVSQTYFVLAGVSVFERQTHWIEQKLNEIATRFGTISPHELELHGSPMRSGKGIWRKIPQADREQAIKDALQFGIADQGVNAVRLFSTVVKKSKLVGIDPVVHSFEQITSRFDMFLSRCHTKYEDTQRGLMLFDESSTEQRIQTLAREFKYNGHSYGKTRNYSEVPVFLDSRASRLIQLADLVAYSIFRHYEYQDSQYFDIFKHRFDYADGVQHGLYTNI
jgi:hypothetical protein